MENYNNELLKTKIKLKFNNEGNFRILCVSDIHGGVGYDKENTVAVFSALIKESKPDLVLLLGDIAGPGVIHISTPDELKTMLEGLTEPLETNGIPWAHVYGNHDNNFGVENEVAQTVYETFDHCISKAGSDDLPGCGNWMLPVYSSDGDDIRFAVYGLDSHRGNDAFNHACGLPDDNKIVLPDNGGFEHGGRGIDFKQVFWYYNTSLELERIIGHKVYSLMTMHVPVRELGWIELNEKEFELDGKVGCDCDCQALNSGMFRACVERGDVKAMCFGHNHRNNFSADYCGIKMCYDGYMSMHACHRVSTLGGRVFEINENNPSAIKSHLVLAKDIMNLEGDNYDWNN